MQELFGPNFLSAAAKLLNFDFVHAEQQQVLASLKGRLQQSKEEGFSTDQSSKCAIKGNISSYGKIYHVPGSNAYESVRIDVSSGERWFCSRDEAEQAGWRASMGSSLDKK